MIEVTVKHIPDDPTTSPVTSYKRVFSDTTPSEHIHWSFEDMLHQVQERVGESK